MAKVMTWNANGAPDNILSKRQQKHDLTLINDLNVIKVINNESITIENSLRTTFDVTQNAIKQDTSGLIDEVFKLPKSIAKRNSRGLGIEFGFSTLPGSGRGKANMEYRNGICQPYERAGNNHPKTQFLQNKFIKPLVQEMWDITNKTFPIESNIALTRTPTRHRYVHETAWSKVTIACNNPTPFHYDCKNMKGTMTAIYIVTDDECEGGDQIITEDLDAVVIKATHGCLIIGDYTRFYHAVTPVIKGNRIAIIAYSMQDIYEYSK